MAKNKLRLVVDTNIFIYALFDDSKINPIQIYDLICKDEFNLFFAQDTFGELIYILKRNLVGQPKPKDMTQDEYDIDNILTINDISSLFYYNRTYNTLKLDKRLEKKIQCKDPRDVMFVKCAMMAKADYFVSDDFKHGVKQYEYYDKNGKIKIGKVVGSEEFIKIYNENYKDEESAS